MALNAPFPYTMDFEMKARNATGVFKLKFGLSGKKYFIFKGLKIALTIENLSKQIYRELNSSHQKEDSILFKVIAYIRTSKVTTMQVEVIREVDDTVELLMTEYESLQAAKGDSDCLNTRFTNLDYYPHWIPQYAINDFVKRLGGIKPRDKDKNLLKFLKTTLEAAKAKNPDEVAESIVSYLTKRYR
jgi:hypothetical protein